MYYRLMRYFIVVCQALFLIAMGGVFVSANAQNIVTFKGKVQVIGKSIEVLTDTNANMPLAAAIQSAGYQKTDNDFPNLDTKPYGYWIRFTIKNQSADTTLAVQFTQPMVDYVDFYQLTNGKVTQKNTSGHRLAFDTRIIKHQTFIYPLNLKKDSESTFYLYVKSGKQLILPFYVGSMAQIVERALFKDITFGIYVGIILVMILYNFFVYTSVRDKNYLYYILYLSMVLLTQASMEGYLLRFVLQNHPLIADMLIYITSALIGLSAIEFSKSFLLSKTYTPGLHKFSYVFWVLYSFQILLAFLGHRNLSYTIMLSTAMFSALYVLFMAIRILLKGSRSAKYFLIAWSIFIVCVVIYVLKDFNVVLPYNDLTNSALLIGSALEAVLLSFALADRINVFKKEKERSQEEALRALQENERIIREQNEILEAKVSDRTFELNKTNRELSVTLDNLKQAQSQLVESEKMASLGQLTAGIAHEINNPINFVTSNINPLKRDIEMMMDALQTIEQVGLSDKPVEAKQKEIDILKEELDLDYLNYEIKHLLKGINEGAVRTAEIVKGLKIFSRLDEDDLKYADLHEGIESTLIISNNMFNNKVAVEKDYGELDLVECYPGKLNQVFLNLISNSVYAINKKFGENAGGIISIKTRQHDGHVFLHFADNGIGMNQDTQHRIFEPFFTTKDVGEGTGLGMSIAYNTIKRHNGNITVNSKQGEGCEFIIELPLKLQ
ncbi:histidine kinase [Mucilaginibacter sp. UR6-1]|uniref:sensor histidine kinase n=1 Tax=Mucilaginibacter sp. UR6-1 TaxID=1435643 RepID=UPI001E616C83|nr:7TM diverse intracellular signaling domain-containing protein [Mucilaginibacter sp. UR6-1]MCC8409306.1 histidine kinase [Mucilaginibacter sp. UR6-1]